MQLKERISELFRAKEPFIFSINYKADDGFVYPISQMPSSIALSFDGISFGSVYPKNPPKILSKTAVDKADYCKKISRLKERIAMGDIYMANLTQPTKIELEGELEDIFFYSKAPYRLIVKDRFVISSPERFVFLKDGEISTYPMKGTAEFIDEKSIERLLADKKELSEHTMTVDLLRNDLSIMARGVRVKEFRKPIVINAGGVRLIQTISKISGCYDESVDIGELLFSLLPAGSITGTPKRKCIEILDSLEGYERGFFCGIFGYFDGQELKSAVSIRFVEKMNEGYLYKSGGGITLDSDAKAEYEEMLKKVYLAV